METALYFILFKSCLFKDFRVRQEINLCSGLFRLSNCRQQSVYQLYRWYATLIAVMMHITISAYLYIHISRKCIYNGGTYSMKTTAGLICCIIKLSTGMQSRKYHTGCRYALLMHSHRNSPSVIFYGTGAICL